MYIPKVGHMVYVKDLKRFGVVFCVRDGTPLIKGELTCGLHPDQPTPQYVIRSNQLDGGQTMSGNIEDLKKGWLVHITSSKILREILVG